MIFDEIYEAACKENEAKLQQIIESDSIDELMTGNLYLSAAAKLAQENNKSAVNFLMAHGANIGYVVMGAALGGHLDYAEELISRGASINPAVLGAAWGGHLDYAEELINRGADIDSAAMGANLGGHINPKNATINFLLSFKDGKNRKKLIDAIERSYHTQQDVKNALPQIGKKVDNILNFKRRYELDIVQAQAIQQRQGIQDILTWFIQCYGMLRSGRSGLPVLPDEILKKISQMVLLPFCINAIQVEDFYFKIQRRVLLDKLDDEAPFKKTILGLDESEQNLSKLRLFCQNQSVFSDDGDDLGETINRTVLRLGN